MSKDQFYWEAGKGSRIRSSEDKKKYEEGWERIFGKKEEQAKEKENDKKQD